MADRRQEGPSKHDSVVVRPDSSLAARIIDAQDNERRKISRELHDSVGQSLVAMKMSIAKCQRENSLDDNADSHKSSWSTMTEEMVGGQHRNDERDTELSSWGEHRTTIDNGRFTSRKALLRVRIGVSETDKEKPPTGKKDGKPVDNGRPR